MTTNNSSKEINKEINIDSKTARIVKRTKKQKDLTLYDLLSTEQTTWDLIILDEGQRIKNWESKKHPKR